MADKVDREFLPFVRRPSRYIGGEINQIKKDLTKCALTIALCFPDIYEIGMSHTGLAIIYDILNNLDSIAAERVFAPWLDAEKILRDKNIPLFSLESKAALASFDIVGFSLTNELCYTNVLNILDLGGINIRSAARGENDPLVIVGGGMANCCEPMADFIDLFLLGEGEEAVVELAELVKSGKQTGTPKKEILAKAAENFDWAYVPNSKLKTKNSKLINAVVEDFENAPVPLKPIVPFTQAVHERVSVEIMRGCPGRCNFCQASFCRRPVRRRSVDKIVEIAKACYHSTGFDTVSLLSLSTADYPELEELIVKLNEYFRDKHVGLSVPSLRVDKQLKLLPQLVTSVRKAGLTIAVEAASERLREIIGKPLKNEDLFAAAEAAYKAGWHRIKLYFMVGLPGETEEDIKQIVELSYQLAKLRNKVDGRAGQINAAVSWLVPKPHTPFGWLGQKPKAYFEQAKQLILDEKRNLRAKMEHPGGMVQFKFHDIERSVLESAIGRGDRRLCDVIEEAWRNGAKFDLWDEYFNNVIWQAAFEKFGLDLNALAEKSFEPDDILPWEHLGGPDKKNLFKLFNEAMSKV
ncbi:MAG: TIGR03960 family B12-binding radical SAM protein [Sedimentisphaerales bacterium]|nr:TIGR03960 family B12-binding radical SAM protein [Sedimentisphaerales bacterium]